MALALIEDIPIAAKETVRWELRSGSEPVEEEFTTLASRQIIDKLTDLGRSHTPVTLTLGAHTNDKLEVKGLFIKEIRPDTNPFEIRIVLVDVRYWFRYFHIRRALNITRRVGVKRRGEWQDELQQDVAPDLRFSKFSLQEPDNASSPPHTPKSSMDSIFNEIRERLLDQIQYDMPVSSEALSAFKQLTFQDLDVDDPGDQAVARVLEFIPGAFLYPDYDGVIQFDNRLSGLEVTQIENLGAEIADQGHITFVSNEFIRPREIHVLFTREVELRFDFEEAEDINATIAVEENQKFADNVIAVPDFSIEIDGEKVAQGTYATLDAYLANIATPTGVIKNINYPLIRKAMIPEMGLWAALGLVGETALPSPKADWAARWGAIQNAYRQLMRINRVWTDRIYSMSPYLVATIDVTSGQRAPAMAFSDYSVTASQRAMLFASLSNEDLPYAFNVPGYPDDAIDAESRPAMADVTIVDADQGIIGVTYKVDAYRFGDRVLPGLIDVDSMPNYAVENWRDNPISFDSVAGNGKVPTLAPGFKLAVLFTAVPAAPNNNNQYERVVVTPDDVESLLKDLGGRKLIEGIRKATGPIMEIRIPPTTETARIAHDDNRLEDFEKMFGIIEGEPNTDGLVVNRSGAGTVRGEEANAGAIDIIALFAAASKYIEFSDRLQGSMQGYMRDIVPSGWLESVVHNILSKGEAITSIGLKKQITPIDPLDLMDNGTRRALLRLVNQSK